MGSKDGSAILCDCGTLGLWDSQTSTWAFSANQGNGTVNGAISGDGNILVQGDYILNPQLLITGQLAHWDFLRGPLGLSGGSDILNSSGSIDYKTDLGTAAINGTGVQIFDANHGDLKDWVELPEPIPNNTQHRLTLDDTGKNLYVLTQSGFTAVHFAFVPLSVAYLKPNQGAAIWPRAQLGGAAGCAPRLRKEPTGSPQFSTGSSKGLKKTTLAVRQNKKFAYPNFEFTVSFDFGEGWLPFFTPSRYLFKNHQMGFFGYPIADAILSCGHQLNEVLRNSRIISLQFRDPDPRLGDCSGWHFPE